HQLDGSLRRLTQGDFFWRHSCHCELSLRPANLRRHAGGRAVDDSGRGRIINSDHHLQPVSHSSDSGLHTMTEPILEMKNVVKYYSDTAVLNGISFSIFRAETKSITGASGAVKST